MEIKRVFDKVAQAFRGSSEEQINASLKNASLKELREMITQDADLQATEELIRRAREKRSQTSLRQEQLG